MQVLTNIFNYVISYATVGSLVDGVEVTEPSDMTHFEENYQAYKLSDGELVFDEAHAEFLRSEDNKEVLRERRETECFIYTDRGRLWYDQLTPQQLIELGDYYRAWLDVTDTLVAPDKPTWLT